MKWCVVIFLVFYLLPIVFVQRMIGDQAERYILVTPDAGGEKRIKEYAKKMQMNYIKLDKHRDYSQPNTVEYSVLLGNPAILTNIQGKTAIIIDDMIDTCGTMLAGTQTLLDHGIQNVVLVATHGIFSGAALDHINTTRAIEHVIVTNTIDQERHATLCPKLIIVDIVPLVSDVIQRLVTQGSSISALF